MTSNLPDSGRVDSTSKSRWAPLSRRGAQPDAALPELRAVPLSPVGPTPEEHHLGARLSAYLDGELGHDSRERVQAHLATCSECLAEAESGRAVKHMLTHTGTPEPSSNLMARLLAVAALPEDDLPGDGPGTFGGSRLTGGSFGSGSGSPFGGGALGAESPIPGIDPRAERSAPPRGRRFVFAAAGAFSVAAVTLGGLGGLEAGNAAHGNTVTPVNGPGSSVLPMTAQLPVDFPMREQHDLHAHSPAPTFSPAGPAAYRSILP